MMKLLAERHHDLARTRNQIACRLHAVLCELVPGGITDEITVAQAGWLLAASNPPARGRGPNDLAVELLDDLRRVDDQLRVQAADRRRGRRVRHHLTEIFGVGPVVAATVIGDTGDIARFPTPTASPPTTAPPPSRCPPGGRKISAAVAPREPPAQPRHPHGRRHPDPPPHSPGRAYYDRKIAEGKTTKEALRALKRRISDAVYRHARRRHRDRSRSRAQRAREGNQGTTLSPARPAHTPNTGSSAKPLPNPTPPYDQPRTTPLPEAHQTPTPAVQNLLMTNKEVSFGA